MDGKVIKYAKPEQNSFYISGRKLQAHNGKVYTATMDNRLLGNLREDAYKSKLAAVYNYDGELVDTIGTYDPTVKNSKSYNLFSIINTNFHLNYLLSTQYYNYRIQIYDLKTKNRLAWFGKRTDHFNVGEKYISPHEPIEKIKKEGAGRSSAVSIHTTDNYILLYFETLTKSFFQSKNFNDKKPYIVIYDYNSYDCYGEIALTYVLGDVANNKLYLIENDNPDHFTIGIYELKEEK